MWVCEFVSISLSLSFSFILWDGRELTACTFVCFALSNTKERYKIKREPVCIEDTARCEPPGEWNIQWDCLIDKQIVMKQCTMKRRRVHGDAKYQWRGETEKNHCSLVAKRRKNERERVLFSLSLSLTRESKSSRRQSSSGWQLIRSSNNLCVKACRHLPSLFSLSSREKCFWCNKNRKGKPVTCIEPAEQESRDD